MNAAAESCPFKIALSGGAGFALGGAFGFLTGAVCSPLYLPSHTHVLIYRMNEQMAYDVPLTAKGTEIYNLPWREQLKHGFKDMGTRAWSSAKTFGYIGAIYTTAECSVEGLRAKNDLTNHVVAGCLTGAFLGRNAGPQAALTGCVGFAAFSTAIEAYMRMPGEN